MSLMSFPSLNSSRLHCCVFSICLLTNIYQKYKSVELGDQLHVLSLSDFLTWTSCLPLPALSTYKKKTWQGSVVDWPTQLIYICQHTTKRQSRVIHLPEQASNQGRPYLSLLLKPKTLHFNCASCAIGGMVRVPLLPRVSCSFALGRRHQVPGISCQVPQVPGTRCQLAVSWLTVASVDCFSHILFEFWKTQVFGFLSVFNMFCTIVWWWISFTGPRISMASARSLVETYFDKNGSSLKKCQAYSGVPNLLTESPLLFFPTFIFWLQGWEVIVISMQKIALGIKCRI